MKAMIFAAGLGSRLYPITKSKPKALANVCGKTLLEHNIIQLKEFGIKELVINVHHHAQQIKDFLNYNNNFDIQISISNEEDKLLDTGGGLKKAAHLLDGDTPVLVKNVDTLSNIDLDKALSFYYKNKALASLFIRNRKSSRYLLFDSSMKLSGWENTNTNEKILCDSSNNKHTQFAFSGIHLISPKLFKLFPTKEIFSIIEFYLEIAKEHSIFGYQHNDDYWFDIGTIEKLNSAEKFLTKENSN